MHRRVAPLLVLALAAVLLAAGNDADASGGTTTLVSKSAVNLTGDGHSCCPAMSSDGRFVAFSTAAENLGPEDHNFYDDIYVVDRQTGAQSLA